MRGFVPHCVDLRDLFDQDGGWQLSAIHALPLALFNSGISDIALLLSGTGFLSELLRAVSQPLHPSGSDRNDGVQATVQSPLVAALFGHGLCEKPSARSVCVERDRGRGDVDLLRAFDVHDQVPLFWFRINWSFYIKILAQNKVFLFLVMLKVVGSGLRSGSSKEKLSFYFKLMAMNKYFSFSVMIKVVRSELTSGSGKESCLLILNFWL